MKQLKREDLVEGEIYKCNTFLFGIFIMKAVGNLMECNSVNEERRSYNTQSAFGRSSDIQKNFIYELATPEEKHWLEVCIAANSFISYEEAVKTFIPEYVECTLQQIGSDYKLGEIYKVNTTSKNMNKVESHNNQGMAFYQMNRNRFKPSTKEAYDAQFIVKEQLEEPKDKVLEKEGIDLNIGKIIRVESSEGAIYQLGDKITVFTKDSQNKGRVLTIKGFRWNNAKTNICAITELHSKNGIGLDKIELYSKPVVKELSLLEQAKLKYPIGTEFKAARGNRNLYTVKSNDIFKENSDNAICIRENGNGTVYFNGEWAEIVEDFKLPETWWITIVNEKQLEIAKQYFSQYFNNLNIFRIGKTVGYVKNVLDNYPANAFNLLTTTKMNNPQITFKQFEQYVLHNGFKVGDRFNKVKSLLNHTAPYAINEREIIDLQYINNESVAFYKMVGNSYSGSQCRILTKNIVK